MRNEFLRVVGGPNESLIHIITYYVQILSWDQNNFARVTSEAKKPFNGSIFAKLVIMTFF